MKKSLWHTWFSGLASTATALLVVAWPWPWSESEALRTKKGPVVVEDDREEGRVAATVSEMLEESIEAEGRSRGVGSRVVLEPAITFLISNISFGNFRFILLDCQNKMMDSSSDGLVSRLL